VKQTEITELTDNELLERLDIKQTEIVDQQHVKVEEGLNQKASGLLSQKN